MGGEKGFAKGDSAEKTGWRVSDEVIGGAGE